MLCFLVKAHHHLNPCLMLSWKSFSPSSFLRQAMHWMMSLREREVLLLYGMEETSQQNSRTDSSLVSVNSTYSRTSILFDFPRIMSYRVPFGIPYRELACVNLSFCVITDSMASCSCVWLQAGTLEQLLLASFTFGLWVDRLSLSFSRFAEKIPVGIFNNCFGPSS